MKRGWNKAGQFYLVAAIVIIAITAVLAVISNYSTGKNLEKASVLKEELGIESSKVLDYIAINNITDKDTIINNFTGNFYNHSATNGLEIYFLTGDGGNIDSYKYSENGKEDVPSETADGKIKININQNDYEFNIEKGENFHFVIYQQIENEKHIVTS
jgi:hypothetical protein